MKQKVKKSIIAEGQGFPSPHKNGCYNIVAKEGLGVRVLGLASLGHTGTTCSPCGCLPETIGDEAIASADMVSGKVSPISLLHSCPSLPGSGFQNMIAHLEGPFSEL